MSSYINKIKHLRIKIVAVLLLSLLTNVVLQAHNYDAKEKNEMKVQVEKEVLAAFEQLVEAATAVDMDSYFDLFDKNGFIGLTVDGRNWNSFDEFKEEIAQGFTAVEKIEKLTFTNVKVTVLNASTAVLVNQYQEVVVLKDGNKIEGAGGGTQVWSKTDGRWQLVSVSASVKH